MDFTPEQIDDLVARLDSFMENGGGHMNVQVDETQNIEFVKVNKTNSTECSSGDTACSVPTLHKGIDDEEL
jgi:hypothetical protein